jgi:hypothetical protein
MGLLSPVSQQQVENTLRDLAKRYFTAAESDKKSRTDYGINRREFGILWMILYGSFTLRTKAANFLCNYAVAPAYQRLRLWICFHRLFI